MLNKYNLTVSLKEELAGASSAGTGATWDTPCLFYPLTPCPPQEHTLTHAHAYTRMYTGTDTAADSPARWGKCIGHTPGAYPLCSRMAFWHG